MSFTSYTGRVRIVTDQPRPDDVPAHWLLMNAPRPLYGKQIPGRGPEGAFVVAIDPADADAAWQVKENRGLDACTLVHLTPAQLFQIGFAHYVAKATTEGSVQIICSRAAEDAPKIDDDLRAILATHGWDVLNLAFNPPADK